MDLETLERQLQVLRASEERLRAMFNHAAVGIAVTDLSGRFVDANQHILSMLGYSLEEFRKLAVSDITHPEHVRTTQEQVRRLVSGESSGYVQEKLYLRKDGTSVWSRTRVTLLRNAAGEPHLMIGAIEDITDRKRADDAAQREIASRERAEAALREADRRKDEFLATLAHELRNPLAPIRQAALISQAPAATETQKRWSHDVISRQVQHMSLLLDDLLDVSRITRGTLELRRQPTELAAIVDAAVETARPAIDAKRHELLVDIPNAALRFSADPLRLAQVLSNLLTNAAKYTDPEGQIRLGAAVNAGTLTLSVTDSGIGIPAEDIAGVFAMFSQVKSTQDRSEGGLGIGLALAKGLVELHGGTLEARSRGVGFGSEFIVHLPLSAVETQASLLATAPRAPRSSSRKVLIADDNRDAAESLAVLLRMDGHEVSIAYDGPQALAMLAQGRPEVALLDIGMPGLNGYEVAKRVRHGPLGRGITLIAVTGWGQDRDKAQAREAGFDHHFTKPVDPGRLSELLRSGRIPG